MKLKKLLSLVLSLSLLLGMIVVPARAAGETTTITPGTDDAKTGTGTMTITLTIPKKTPEASNFAYTAPSDLTYNGSAKATTVAVSSGVTGMGAITVKYYSDANRTTEAMPVNVGTYYVGIAVAEGDYYNASTSVLYGDGWNFTVTPASVTLTASSDTKTYNGQEQTATGFTSSVNGLTFAGVSASGSGTGAGTYNVTFSGVTVNTTTDSTGNYVVTGTTNGTLTINRAAVTVKADDKSKTVGAADPELTATVTGLVNGEAASLISYTLSRAAGDTAGTYTITPSGEATQGNYSVTYQTGTLTISDKATQTITAENVTATYGDTGKSVSGTTSGDGKISYAVTSGDAVTVDAESGALTILKAGTAVVTVTAAETDNYAAATKDVTVTIEKKALTVKAKDQSIYVNGTLPDLTSADSYTVTGLVGEDTLTTPPTLAYQKDGSAATPDTTTTGTYDIVPSGAAADNYTISYESGTLTISRRPSSGPSTPPTTTVTVPVSGDDESVNVTVRVSGDTATITIADVDKVLDAEDVGTVTIDVSTLNNNVTEVVIPGAMVDKIADAVADEENNADGLEIKLPSGTVTFDTDAVAAIAEQANGKDLRLNLEDIGESKLNTAQKSAVDDMNVQKVLDVYMTSGGQRISDFKGGKAVVEVSYTLKEGQTGRGVIVWYVADDGTKTEVPTTYNDKAVSFTVEHFSNYVIAYDEERAAACPRDDTCPMSAFSDLDKTKWYHDALHYALENKIMVGVGDGKFNPNGTMSRAMFATILYRIAGEPEVTGENTFTDVEAGRWYTDAAIWAAGEKIIEGYGNNIFGTNDPVTREQMAAIFWRYQGKPAAENADLSAFSDTGKISTWAQDAFEWAVSAGIISGKGGGILDPKGDATRAEVAQIVMNYDLKVK